MPVYLDKRRRRLFIQFQLHGERYKYRLPDGITKKAAIKLEVQMKSRILLEEHGAPAPRADLTFERFIQDVYLPFVENNHSTASFEKAIVVCRAALPFFKGKQLRNIKPADIERFKDHRATLLTQYDRPRQPATVVRELSIISKIFSMAVKNDLCEYNPCSRVEKPKFDNVMNKVLRPEHERQFFDAFDKTQGEWAKDICRIVLHTGLRQNDVLGLQKFHVDLTARVIRLVQGKTKRRVEVPLTDTAFDILERRMRQPGLLLFPSPKTHGTAKSIRTAISNACARAGIERLTIRDLRRTCATRLDDRGFSSATIAKFLGHSDLRSVHRYQRSEQALRDAAEALENFGSDAPNAPATQLRKIK